MGIFIIILVLLLICTVGYRLFYTLRHSAKVNHNGSSTGLKWWKCDKCKNTEELMYHLGSWHGRIYHCSKCAFPRRDHNLNH